MRDEPVGRWSVVQRVVAHLHLEVKDDRTDGEGVADKVLADDDQRHSSTANVLLGSREDGTELAATYKPNRYTDSYLRNLYTISSCCFFVVVAVFPS